MNATDVLKQARFSPDKMQKVNLCETANFFCDVYGLEAGQALGGAGTEQSQFHVLIFPCHRR